jgi:restriction endonuclease S subunit
MYGQGATRGRTAKLGLDATTNQACAVLYNIDNLEILTDYLWLYLINEYDRLRAMASGNNQPNLNGRMIKDYLVIIPPKSIQEEIIATVAEFKFDIKKLRHQAESNRHQAIQEFENEIFKPCN